MLGCFGCGKDDGGGGESATKPSPGLKANPDKVAALKKTWESNADCQKLTKCCASIPGTAHESTIGKGLCSQVTEQQDFEKAVKNMVDPAWMSNLCKTQVKNLPVMKISKDPLPAACN